MVSVVMPIYQTNEAYLREAIESVLNQSHTNFEFLIVNDSPHDSRRLKQIVDSYADRRIIWIATNANSGIAAASNLGINQAEGSYIAMLDNDDICIATRLEKQLEFLKDNPEIGFVGGQAEGFYPDKSTVKLDYCISSSMSQLKQSFFDGVPFPNPGIMFRKSALGSQRYNPNYKVCADYEFFARLVFAYMILWQLIYQR